MTSLYTSRITTALSITVSGPITDETGEIKGVLGLDIRFEDLTKAEIGTAVEVFMLIHWWTTEQK